MPERVNDYKYLIRRRLCLFPAVFNLFLNAAIAVVLFRNVDYLARGGASGFLFDMAITIVLTSLFNTMDGVKKIKKHISNNAIKPLTREKPFINNSYLNDHPLIRSLAVAVLFSLVLYGIIYIIVSLLDITKISYLMYIGIKGVLAAIVAYLIVYISAFIALHDTY